MRGRRLRRIGVAGPVAITLVASAWWLTGLRALAEVREFRGSYREDENLLLMPTRVAIAALVSVHLRASFGRIEFSQPTRRLRSRRVLSADRPVLELC
jgi:hypothetical protein